MDDGDAISFGATLRALRREAGLSQRELAERTNLDFSYISKVENERLPPPAADTVVAICRVLGAPSEELLALTGKIPSEVQQTISRKRAAQRFLLEAHEMGLTDEEWSRMEASLRQLRSEP
jgi:HTH-type transcriptional regulator, competence development regulator